MKFEVGDTAVMIGIVLKVDDPRNTVYPYLVAWYTNCTTWQEEQMLFTPDEALERLNLRVEPKHTVKVADWIDLSQAKLGVFTVNYRHGYSQADIAKEPEGTWAKVAGSERTEKK